MTRLQDLEKQTGYCMAINHTYCEKCRHNRVCKEWKELIKIRSIIKKEKEYKK